MSIVDTNQGDWEGFKRSLCSTAPDAALTTAASPLDLHQSALQYAKAGIPIFPCLPNSKIPATSNGFKDATTDEATINAWWSQEPEYNIAFSPETVGWGVIDLDGEDGIRAWDALPGEKPATYTVRTPRGGKHLYFVGRLPASQGLHSSRAPWGEVPIDTRGVGSYVLAPPSHVCDPDRGIDGTYVVEHDADVSPLPEWIKFAPRVASPPRTDYELDMPSAFGRAVDYLRRRAPAIEGQQGNSHTYATAAKLVELGLSAEGIVRAMVESGWNDRCVPPWDIDAQDGPDALATLAAHAFQYATSRGASVVRSPEEAFGDYVRQLPAETEREDTSEPTADKTPSRFILRDWQTRRDAKPVEPLIDNLLPDTGTALIYAPRSSYKSFVALGIAFAVATGRAAFGRLRVHRSGTVVYFAGEGLAAVEKQRLAVLCQDAGIPDDARMPIYTVAGVPLAREPDEADALIQAIKHTLHEDPVLIVVDTLARSMGGLNENDAGDAGRFLEMVETLANRLHCLVLTIAHEGKDEKRGTRGSSAFEAGVDVIWHADAHEGSLAVELRSEKEKDGEAGGSVYLQGRAIELPGSPRGSLVFHAIDKDEYQRANGTSKGTISRSDVGRALQDLRAVNGVTVETSVLANAIARRAGGGTDSKGVAAKVRFLQKHIADFHPYLAHESTGRGDGSLWTFPTVDDEGMSNA